MMKKIGLFTGAILLVFNMGLLAQGNEIDAFTLTNSDLGGTARSMSMAGAFGALGGDVSTISNNPAGLGIYRSSEIAGTLDLSMVNASTSWGGVNIDQNKTRFSPNNVGFTLYFPTNSASVRNWNLGFSYNRLKNFNRNYKMSNNGQDYSMADYVAWRASNAFGYGNGITQDELTYVKGGYDPYKNRDLAGEWLPILGFESEFFGHYAGAKNEYQSSFGKESGNQWVIDSPIKNSLAVSERGHMDEYNFGFGMNISNFLFLGASFSVTDIKYEYSSSYQDNFASGDQKDDYLYLGNSLTTEGTAASVSVGAIANFQMVRLGVAYNSPRWYDMTDYFFAQAESYIGRYNNPFIESWTPEDAYQEYKFRTPGKWIFSGAVILGQSALVSADYEIMDYSKMRFSDKDGNDDYYTNDYIGEDYTWSHTFKIGTEIKVTPQFAVRAGYMIQTPPMREALANNNVEVLPAGTIPHFTVTSKPTNYYTVGFGYRFTPNFYMDLACVYRYNNSHAYAFSNTYTPEEAVDVYSEPGSLKTKTTRLALTLGYKF